MTGFAPVSAGTHVRSQKFVGKARIIGPKWLHLPTLTLGLLGVQIFWSVEMGYASPYLLSLGFSKSSTAIVFLAGPLSGLIMQPVIGMLADSSTSRFGRRRPYMMIGTVVCALAMLLLGYTRGFSAIFTGRNTPSNDALTIVLAVLSIYLIDFSINAVMAMDRALLVDTLPPVAQASGNAWAACMLGVGAVVGFFVGTIPLPSIFPFLGTTELQVLSVFVSILLLSVHTLAATCVKERILLKSTDQDYSSAKRPNVIIREFRDLWSNVRTLPPVILQICMIQFFAWIAWFPQLFYTTVYIGDLYKRSTPLAHPGATPDPAELHARDAEATRLGTRALFYSAILALFINLVLPAFVATPVSRAGGRSHRREPSVVTATKQTGWIRIPERLKINLASLWAISHLVLAGCLLGTLFTDSVTGTTFLVSIMGFSWAITQWAPFSLLGEAILTTPDPSSSEMASIRLADARTPTRDEEDENEEREVFLAGHEDDGHHQRGHEGGSESGDESESGVEPRKGRPITSKVMFGNSEARVSRLHVAEGLEDGDWEGDDFDELNGGRTAEQGIDDEEGVAVGTTRGAGGLSAKAGIILGIHNVFIVIPQILVTGLSAVIFAIFDPVQPQSAVVPPPPKPPPPPTETGLAQNVTKFAVDAIKEAGNIIARDLAKNSAEEIERGGQSNSVVYVFRLGGISALIAFILCWRLAKKQRHR